MTIISKIYRKLTKLRLQPIRIFCLHHVCEQFDADTMHACDWMALEDFKQKIKELRNQGYLFISLTDAYNHLTKDLFRRKKYVVLTFDDGYKSLIEVLPWLEEQQIPTTLFINGKYLDGKSFRDTHKEQYLTYSELFALNSPLIEIGSHGWEHNAANEMSSDELKQSIQKNTEILSPHPQYVPFWAYTYGRHSIEKDIIIIQNDLIPVLVAGNKNYQWMGSIDRELM